MLGFGVGVWGVGRGRGGCAGLSGVPPHVLIVFAYEIYYAIWGNAHGRARARSRATTRANTFQIGRHRTGDHKGYTCPLDRAPLLWTRRLFPRSLIRVMACSRPVAVHAIHA